MVRFGVSRDNPHWAIYPKSRTVIACVQAIQAKFLQARERSFVLYLTKDNGVQFLVDNDVLEVCPNEQDFVVSYEASSIRHAPRPLPDLHENHHWHRDCEPMPTSSLALTIPWSDAGQELMELEQTQVASIDPKLLSSNATVTDCPMLTSVDHTNLIRYTYRQPYENKSGNAQHPSRGLPSTGTTTTPYLPIHLDTGDMLPNTMHEEIVGVNHRERSQVHRDFIRRNFDKHPQITKPVETRRSLPRLMVSDSQAITKQGRATVSGRKQKDREPRTKPMSGNQRRNMLERNRLAASKCRARGRISIKAQTTTLEVKAYENSVLQNTVRDLREQARVMRHMVDQHSRCYGNSLPSSNDALA